MVDARLLFCDCKFEGGLQEGLHLPEEGCCLLFATNDSNEEIIGLSRVEESSVGGVERVACG